MKRDAPDSDSRSVSALASVFDVLLWGVVTSRSAVAGGKHASVATNHERGRNRQDRRLRTASAREQRSLRQVVGREVRVKVE